MSENDVTAVDRASAAESEARWFDGQERAALATATANPGTLLARVENEKAALYRLAAAALRTTPHGEVAAFSHALTLAPGDAVQVDARSYRGSGIVTDKQTHWESHIVHLRHGVHVAVLLENGNVWFYPALTVRKVAPPASPDSGTQEGA